MNIGQWALLFLGIAVLVLVPALVGGIVQPAPDVGGTPWQFTGNVSYIQAVTCCTVLITPQANRNVSNLLFAGTSVADVRGLSQMVWAWAQFIQHDIFLFTTNSSSIQISLGASNMTLYQVSVSSANCSSPNGRTSLLDGSPIYSDAANPSRLSILRSGTFGTLRQSQGAYLPLEGGNFYAGDVNVNENPQLAALITLFVREHNYWCRQLRQINPLWTDDQLFWKARSYVLVEIQRITWEEWLPAVLGGFLGINPPYTVPNLLNGSLVSAEFATIASEFYRSQLANEGTYNISNVTTYVLEQTLETILTSAWRQPSLTFDVQVSATQCNGSQAFDYMTQTLTRVQEFGVTTNYSQLCSTFGTVPKTYANTSNILASVWNESPPTLPGSSLQLTTIVILLEQLQRSRRIDENWYALSTTAQNVGKTFYPILASTQLVDIIYRNTQITPCRGCNLDTSVFWVQQ